MTKEPKKNVKNRNLPKKGTKETEPTIEQKMPDEKVLEKDDKASPEINPKIMPQ